jgi:hypothetical protein
MARNLYRERDPNRSMGTSVPVTGIRGIAERLPNFLTLDVWEMSEVSRLQVIDFDFLFKSKLNRIYRVDIFQHLLGLFFKYWSTLDTFCSSGLKGKNEGGTQKLTNIMMCVGL